MTDDEQRDIHTQLAVLTTKLDGIESNLARRVKFLEGIVFGFVGLMVIGVLTTIGGVVIWAVKSMRG